MVWFRVGCCERTVGSRGERGSLGPKLQGSHGTGQHPQHCQQHPPDADAAWEWGDHTIGRGGRVRGPGTGTYMYRCAFHCWLPILGIPSCHGSKRLTCVFVCLFGGVVGRRVGFFWQSLGGFSWTSQSFTVVGNLFLFCCFGSVHFQKGATKDQAARYHIKGCEGVGLLRPCRIFVGGKG